MIHFIRKHIRIVASFMAINLLAEVIAPNVALALTGGPSQPEVQSFEPVGTSEMVDVFSGDFNYNIPLLDVDGYPVNISYHSGIGMDDEASWVGLGWNINPGVVNRSMRGLPDDFSGDQITKEFNMRPNRTVGLSTDPLSLEIFGLKIGDKAKKLFGGLNANFGVKYNNYKGVGYDFGVSMSKSIGPFRGQLGANYSSDGGFGISPSLSFATTTRDENKEATGTLNMSVGTSVNSRSGMQALNYGGGFTPALQTAALSNALSMSGSGTYSFGTKTWVPNISMPMKSVSVTLGITTGADFFGSHPNFNFQGSYSTQSLRNKIVSKKAYGYYYEQNKGNNDDVLLDFNREKDGSFNENSVNLPIASHTYDIMSASGHGLGGSFRAKRNDVAALHDDRSMTSSTGGSIGVELGIGNLAHNGVDINANYNYSKSGLWKEGNNLLPRFDFTRYAYAGYEPAYFKNGGDVTPTNKSFHNALFNDEVVRPNTLGQGVLSNAFMKKTGASSEKYVLPQNRSGKNIANKRAIRNQVLSFLNAKDADKWALNKKIFSAGINATYSNNFISGTYLSRTASNDKKDHHMSEVSILKEDGMTYVYGIPAYNNKNLEKSFNVGAQSGVSAVCESGQVSYSPGNDNTRNNNKGLDHYFNSTSTPAYAHSFLLTSVLSQDYVDIRGDGITDDDLGSAVKFNYSRVHSNYRWRIPYNQNKANYSEGLKSNINDDKGSYAYGEKEIWYTHSIEGKNHVALFKISQREDGLGVQGENGGKDLSQRQYKLDKIELYAKQDFIRYGTSAVPVKVVHFKYDYSLCPGVENNSGTTVMVNGENINIAKGKLTLKEIYFTYGKSGKGRLNSYKFAYSSSNPSYHLKGHDIWGNYKPAPNNCCGNQGNLSNSDFPYVNQNRVSADQNVQAWTMTQIHLPSGGKIIIDYESDDYAYVQNRQAMQMMKIKGFGYDNNGTIIKDPSKTYTNNQYDLIFFELQSALTGGSAQADLKQKYLRGVEDLQFTIFSDINNKGRYEYVKGYAELDLNRCGVTDGGSTGWVAMKKVKIGDKHPAHKNKNVNPVARAVWNYAKMNAPHLVYPYQSDDAKDAKGQILSLLGIFTDIHRMVEGFNHSLMTQKFGQRFNSSKSWVRLLSPDKKKIGGGARVKKIKMNDNWAEMGTGNNGATDEEYGQEYDYTMKEKQSNGETWEISSGVAAFEPGVGRDENPFVLPRVITIENKLVPNDDILMEEPIGESFYPGPNVGYRQVTSKSLTKTAVARTGTGKEVSKFYTAYDYPVIVRESKLQKNYRKDDPFWSFLYKKKEEWITASQGYVIELNDMHGKPKEKWSYSETSVEPISGTKFIYQDEKKNGVNCLNNNVLQLEKDGDIISNEIGVDIEMVNDFRKNKDESISGGLKVNTEAMLLFIAPIIVPTILPSVNVTRNEVYTAVTTKVINRSGILKETKAFQEGAMISSQNHLYDAETGSLLLTSVQNEFKDRTFSFTQPAHWAYEGMGQAYKNIGLEFNHVTITSSAIRLPNNLNTEDYLVEGDKVLLTYFGGSTQICYVFKGDDGILNLINKNGIPFEDMWIPNCKLKVLKSGRKNLHNSPIGSIITKTNPITGPANNMSLQFQDILNVEAMEYSDKWQTFVPYIPKQSCDSLSVLGVDMFNLFNMLASETELFDVDYSINYNELYVNNEYPTAYRIDHHGDTILAPRFVYDQQDSLFLKYDGGPFIQYNPFDSSSQYFNTHYVFDHMKIFENNLPISIRNYYENSALRAYNDTMTLDGNQCPSDTVVSRNWSGSFKFFQHCCNLSLEFPDAKEYKRINSFLSIKSINDYKFSLTVELTRNDNSLDTVTIGGATGLRADNKTPCYELFNCPPECYNVFYEKYINPYVAGLAGNWHPLRAYKYLDNRDYNPVNEDPRNDGIYSNYSPFWTFNSSEQKYDAVGTSVNEWVWTSKTTKYTPFGNEIETQDALGRYSAALFGYHFTTPIAVASNSRVSQIAYDGFEDYDFLNQYAMYLCTVNHFNFSPTLTPWNGDVSVDNSVRHSGRNSLKLKADKSAAISRQLDDLIQNTFVSNPNISRTLKPTDDVGIFRPEEGKYIVSAWVKEDRLATATNYDKSKVEVKFTFTSSPSTTIEFKAKGPKVEGWQRIEGELIVPSGAQTLELKLLAADDAVTWFDDVRVHPIDGNMVSYAYDVRTMKLLAQLDENNYATFYEYDVEGTLIRVKKETEKGVQTLKETRNHYYKK